MPMLQKLLKNMYYDKLYLYANNLEHSNYQNLIDRLSKVA